MDERPLFFRGVLLAIPISLAIWTVLMACVLIFLMLAGCTDGSALSEVELPAFDQAGNRYPAACMRDLSDVKVPVTFLPQEGMDQLGSQLMMAKKGKGQSGHILGWFQYLPPHIYIYNGLTGAKKADAIRHEKCHARVGEWHR